MAIAALQPLILLDLDHDGPLAAVARDGDGLRECEVLVSADIALEFGGGDFDHGSELVSRGSCDHMVRMIYAIRFEGASFPRPSGGFRRPRSDPAAQRLVWTPHNDYRR